MNKTAIGVAAALLLGGGAAYGAYQLIGGEPDAAVALDERQARPAGETRELLAERAGGRGGVPDGTDALDFGGGQDGADLTARQQERLRALEAEREAERLAMLGTGDVDMSESPEGDASGGGGAIPDRVETAREDRRRGLRDAPSAPVPAARDAEADDQSDVDALLERLAAEEARPEEANAPGAAARLAGGKRLVDKPDRGGFAAKLVDKPDEGGFVASADTQRFDPCLKADGTPYVGPGTALNPFAETDPCLPRATAQGYQLARAGSPPSVPQVDVANGARNLVPVDVSRPVLLPPPPVGTGSDYGA